MTSNTPLNLDHLSEESRKVTQEKGTEVPFSGIYNNHYVEGLYRCVVCNTPLFSSETKYHSDTPGLRGWPSFDQALPGAVLFIPDESLGMNRTEVVCAHCKAHLGHIFEDPDAKTGKHYCINSCSLDFEKKDE